MKVLSFDAQCTFEDTRDGDMTPCCQFVSEYFSLIGHAKITSQMP